jgi:hypothetical protein
MSFRAVLNGIGTAYLISATTAAKSDATATTGCNIQYSYGSIARASGPGVKRGTMDGIIIEPFTANADNGISYSAGGSMMPSTTKNIALESSGDNPSVHTVYASEFSKFSYQFLYLGAGYDILRNLAIDPNHALQIKIAVGYSVFRIPVVRSDADDPDYKSPDPTEHRSYRSPMAGVQSNYSYRVNSITNLTMGVAYAVQIYETKIPSDSSKTIYSTISGQTGVGFYF